MKRIVVVLIAAAGALALAKKSQDQQAERDLWAEATDEVSNN
ncbi:MAG: DLW-39 family protein [Ornithinimicrobium sp.]